MVARGLLDEAVHGLEELRLDVVRLSGRLGDVPAVQHDLVERDEPGHLAGQVDAARAVMPSHALGSRQASASSASCRGRRVRQSAGRCAASARGAAPSGVLRAAAVKADDSATMWSSSAATDVPSHGVN